MTLKPQYCQLCFSCATKNVREKLDCEMRNIQECILVGCVSADAVTTTRYQYRGIPTLPPWDNNPHSRRQVLPGIRHPVGPDTPGRNMVPDRKWLHVPLWTEWLTDASKNITFHCGSVKKNLHVIISTICLQPRPGGCSRSKKPGSNWTVDDVDPGGEGATLGPTGFR